MNRELPPITILQFVPLPCQHEKKWGRPHASNAALIRCLGRNGVPGFKVTEVRA